MTIDPLAIAWATPFALLCIVLAVLIIAADLQ
jgi:hypothetical protein